MYRRALVWMLLLSMWMQSGLVGYAAVLSVNSATQATSDTACPVHASMLHGHSHSSHHSTSTPSSCIAHCAAVTAVVSCPPILSADIVRAAPERAPAPSFLSERPAPGLRPPIA
jgi:hypothetical protein